MANPENLTKINKPIDLLFNFSSGRFIKSHELEVNNTHGDTDLCTDIKCDYDATCEIGPDKFPRCSCIFNCSDDNNVSPICGSDLRTYKSLCFMKMEGCQKQLELRLRPMELCQGMCNYVI